MVFWYLVSLMLTANGAAVADIPRPFVSQAICTSEGLRRAVEIAADANLSHGVWSCFSIDFAAADPMPVPPAPPLEQKREG